MERPTIEGTLPGTIQSSKFYLSRNQIKPVNMFGDEKPWKITRQFGMRDEFKNVSRERLSRYFEYTVIQSTRLVVCLFECEGNLFKHR